MSATPFRSRMVGGVPFQVASLDQVADWLLTSARHTHDSLNVRLANAYNVALADREPAYKRILVNEGVNFPDGTPVVWFMNRRSQAHDRAGRVRGPSLFVETLRRSSGTSVRHFLLGSTPATLASLETEIERRFPGTLIAGTYSPPFAPVTQTYADDCAARVAASDADIVWLGLGTPKQDVLGTMLAKTIDATTVNVGAAFDFVAGSAREAPVWIQRSGFEWLFRLASEPRRLWRRYVFGNSRFLKVAIAGTDRTGGRNARDAD